MKKDRFTREQRRHAHFVLESEGKYLRFDEDGQHFGFIDLKDANAFTYKDALQLNQVIKTIVTDIKILIKSNGKLKAV